MNMLFPLLIAAALIVSFFTGKADLTFASGLDAASDAVRTVLSLAGMLCFWSGILEIIERSGIAKKIEKLLFPITRRLFPNLKKDSDALVPITENISANLLGMGNAATPTGLRAMSELDKINPHPKTPTDEMCIFTILNTSSLQLIPTTVISLRASCAAARAGDILPAVWICSAISLAAALFCMKIILHIKREKL